MTPSDRLCADAQAIYRQTLGRLHGRKLMADALRSMPPFANRSLIVCGVGKAAVAMVQGVQDAADEAGRELKIGPVVCRPGAWEGDPGFPVIAGGHPIPNEASLAAGDAMVKFAREAAHSFDREGIIFCLSGGASALLEQLPADWTLEEWQALNAALLQCGAPIDEINAVRRAVSKIKGGQLAMAFGEAPLAAYVISDVPGNDLGVIGSGPLHPANPAKTASQVAKQYDELGPWRGRFDDEPSASHPRAVPHQIISGPDHAAEVAQGIAQEFGYVLAQTPPLRGNLPDWMDRFGQQAKAGDRPTAWITVGEGTLRVDRALPGEGGRCQHLSLLAHSWVAKHPVSVFLAGATDGSDGTTSAAGGIIDHDWVCAPGRQAEIREALARADSGSYLADHDRQLVTGPTGTNVNDLVIALSHPDRG